MTQVIEHIDQKTITTQGYSNEDINADAGEDGFRQDSITRDSATLKQIE